MALVKAIMTFNIFNGPQSSEPVEWNYALRSSINRTSVNIMN